MTPVEQFRRLGAEKPVSEGGIASKRFHDLDALRATAMFLGIVLHGLLFLLPTDLWIVSDAWVDRTDPSRNIYVYLFAFIHGFRMPVFFLLSGFFAAMLWNRRGWKGLLKHRLIRIALPLAVCLFTVIPLTEALLIPMPLELRIWLTSWLEGPKYLWFLWHLLIFTVLVVLAFELGLRFRSRFWLLLIPFTITVQYSMTQKAFGADLLDYFFPAPRVLIYNAIFFVIGVYFYQTETAMRRLWAGALAPALILVFPAGLATLFAVHSMDPVPFGVDLANSALLATFAWLMCFGMIGLFRLIAVKERFWVRYASDASYWFYICHFPLIAALHYLIVDQPINAHLKLIVVLAAVIGILMITYQLGVRYTVIGNVLNGPRKRR